MPAPLPIDEVLPQVCAGLREKPCAVVVAPPGSGKTTRVPPALLEAGLLGEGRLLLLQPRRVAARLCARRMAEERGSALGEEVGYQIRFERRVGPRTRIEVLTEGLLTRRLVADPGLEGVSVVVLDELHERNLMGELNLAMLLALQRELRPELRIVLMSATIEASAWVRHLGGPERVALVEGQGRPFPVELRYDPRPDERPLERRVAAAALELSRQGRGTVLCFLPGVGEIERAREALGQPEGVEVLALHGRQSSAEQDRALSPLSGPRIVLATNIAETSLTLPEVVGVVDSGLERQMRYDPQLGLERLERVPIARDSADQRAGRAGRTQAGLCRRLWTEAEHRGRPPSAEPELRRADLAPLLLDLAAWGLASVEELPWLEAPRRAQVEPARRLLVELGALDAEGAITPLGQRLSALPLHPRLGRAVWEGHRRGVLRAAATAAALATEKDPWAGRDLVADVLDRVEMVDQRGTGADPRALSSLRAARDQLVEVAERAWGAPARPPSRPDQELLRSLIAAFPDRVGQRREALSRRFRLSSGRGASLGPGVEPGDGPLIIALVLEGAATGLGADLVVRAAAALEPGLLPQEEHLRCEFDRSREAAVALRERRFGALVLEERPAEDADPMALSRCLLEAAQADPARALEPSEESLSLFARLAFLAHVAPELGLPALGPADLLPELVWGRRSFAHLRAVDLGSALRERLGHPAWSALEREAPARWPLPSGATAAIAYGAPDQPPVLAARVQQLYGMRETPRVGCGRVPLMLHLLAPNNRPAQVTQDIAGFWSGSYAEVRKELRGRYPRHAWPEDPWTAIPENRPTRRS